MSGKKTCLADNMMTGFALNVRRDRELSRAVDARRRQLARETRWRRTGERTLVEVRKGLWVWAPKGREKEYRKKYNRQ